jgi:hypothetical protein
MTLQEPLDQLLARLDLDGKDDARVALLHSRDRHGNDVAAGTQYGADGGLACETRFERGDFLPGEPKSGQRHPGVPYQDLAVAGGRHASGMPLEQFHIERIFDLAQQLGGGRLGETGSGGGPRQRTLLIEVNE